MPDENENNYSAWISVLAIIIAGFVLIVLIGQTLDPTPHRPTNGPYDITDQDREVLRSRRETEGE